MKVSLFNNNNPSVDAKEVARQLGEIAQAAKSLHNANVYRQCLSVVDYTSLNATDSPARGKLLAEKINHFSTRYPSLPNVAGICVYPSLVEGVRSALTEKSVKVVSVAAGFPASQTLFSVKKLECEAAVAGGATEVDVVMSLGRFLDGDDHFTFHEIASLKAALTGKGIHLKVILETGLLPSLPLVYKASMGCLTAGADFIKTSTGKVAPAATPEAALVMCRAIKDFYAETGVKKGFKAAGGIATTADAVTYYAIVKHVLGDEWLTPELLRIGASRLANSLLSDITGKEEKYF
ncbi:MAG: deoxyribose-phosphate aldolase [Prevotellaceae bacterium]|nr:deoxyribose-phosphate aldolase [Prevotellaceae bacterium]